MDNDYDDGVLRDVLRGKRQELATFSLRLPKSVVALLRKHADKRGVSVTSIIVETLTNKRAHPMRTEAAVDARPWTALGYRIVRAIEAIEKSESEIAVSELRSAQKVIVEHLTEIRKRYDAELDALPNGDR